jgi:hypothetical protein
MMPMPKCLSSIYFGNIFIAATISHSSLFYFAFWHKLLVAENGADMRCHQKYCQNWMRQNATMHIF